MSMSYFIIYFRDSFETIFKQQLYSSEKDVEVAIATLLIISWISSDQNYDKIVAIFAISAKPKVLLKQKSLIHLIFSDGKFVINKIMLNRNTIKYLVSIVNNVYI